MFWLPALFTATVVGRSTVKQKKEKERLKQLQGFSPKNVFGEARWADNSDLRKAGLFKEGGIHFGFSPKGGKPLNYQKSGHILIVAAARTGKLLTVICGIILSLTRRYSLLLVDPKGEMTSICGKARSRFGKVFVWNPYGICLDYMKGLIQASWNPMMDIDWTSINAYSDMFSLISTFWKESATNNDPHWSPSAHTLVATVGYVLGRYGKEGEKNLPTIRAVLTGAYGKSFYSFAREAMRINDSTIRQGLARYAAPEAEESKELQGIISTAITQTAWLSNRAIADTLMRADFSLRDPKRKSGVTISAVQPVHRLGDGQAFALFSGWALHCMLDEGHKGQSVPCVVVLDEMSQIGYSKAWLDAFALAAGAAGVQLVAVYQDVSQIMNQFGNAWRTVIQNCGVTLWFGARDSQTQQTVSELTGVTEVHARSKNIVYPQGPNIGRNAEPQISVSISQASRPFVHPADVGRLEADEMIAFVEGVKSPIKAKRKPYTRIFSNFSPNPYYDARSQITKWLTKRR